jgi:carbonic anhydrase
MMQFLVVHKKSDGSAYAVIGGFVQFGPTSSPMISELVKVGLIGEDSLLIREMLTRFVEL